MGFYPVNPVSGEYVVGSPFFDKITIELPPKPQQKDQQQKRTLPITALVDVPIIRHKDITDGREIVFEVSDVVEEWGNENLAIKVK
ncbi:hypothetical protein DXG01_008708 [Tephrocybe rancida]|nr:hypothetical protein DXG01_008708 [Tephrocybe rancida]